MIRVHATCVALAFPEGYRGVLLRGASGSGKSDLALRLMEAGAALVADDQVIVERAGGALIARAPRNLHGRMEVRGVGILPLPALPEAALALIVDLVPPAEVPRLPAPRAENLEGLALPLLALDAFAASSPAKIRLALAARDSHS